MSLLGEYAPAGSAATATSSAAVYKPPGSSPTPIRALYQYVAPETREAAEAEEAARRARSAGIPAWAWAASALVVIGGYVVWRSRR